MIHNFEEYTHPLTDYEKNTMLPLFLESFKNKIGVEKAITNKDILKGFKSKVDSTGKPYKINDARVRKLINHIRVNALIEGLIATSKGYYISNDPVEIARYIDSLRARAGAIDRIADAMKKTVTKYMHRGSTAA